MVATWCWHTVNELNWNPGSSWGKLTEHQPEKRDPRLPRRPRLQQKDLAVGHYLQAEKNAMMWVKPCHKPPIWEGFTMVYTTYLWWLGDGDSENGSDPPMSSDVPVQAASRAANKQMLKPCLLCTRTVSINSTCCSCDTTDCEIRLFDRICSHKVTSNTSIRLMPKSDGSDVCECKPATCFTTQPIHIAFADLGHPIVLPIP